MRAATLISAALLLLLCICTQRASAVTLYSYTSNCTTSSEYLTYQSFPNDKCVQFGSAPVYMSASCDASGTITVSTCFGSPNCDSQCSTSTKQDGQCDGNIRWSCETKQPKADEVVFALYNASSGCAGNPLMWGAFNTKCISNSSSFSVQYTCENGQPSSRFCFSGSCNGTCYTRPIDKCMSGTVGYSCGAGFNKVQEDEDVLSEQLLGSLASLIQSRMQQYKEMKLEEESDVEQMFMKTIGEKIKKRYAKFKTPKQPKQPKTPKQKKQLSQAIEEESDQFLTSLNALILKRLDMYKHMKLSDELEELLSDEVFLKTLRKIYYRK